MIWNLIACVGGASVEIEKGEDDSGTADSVADTDDTEAGETADTDDVETGETADTSEADPFEGYGTGSGPNPVTESDEKIDGQDVTWYTPAGADPLGVLVWSHGFARSKDQHAAAARRAASWGFVVVAVNLPNYSDHEANGAWLADTVVPTAIAVAGVDAARTGLVGHSAGGLASFVAAAQAEVGVYVGLDPVDASDLGLSVQDAVTVPALMTHGEPSTCNADGNSVAWAPAGEAWSPSFVDANHCDFESDSDWVCEIVCGYVDGARQERIQAYALAWAGHHLVGGLEDWLPGGAQLADDVSAGLIIE